MDWKASYVTPVKKYTLYTFLNNSLTPHRAQSVRILCGCTGAGNVLLLTPRNCETTNIVSLLDNVYKQTEKEKWSCRNFYGLQICLWLYQLQSCSCGSNEAWNTTLPCGVAGKFYEWTQSDGPLSLSHFHLKDPNLLQPSRVSDLTALWSHHDQWCPEWHTHFWKYVDDYCIPFLVNSSSPDFSVFLDSIDSSRL